MRKTLLLVAFVAIGAWSVESSAQVIYSDTFSRTTGSGDANGDPNGADPNFSDWGSNDNGLGGSVSQAWIAGPDRAGGGRNAVTDGTRGLSFGTSSFFDFDVTALAANGFRVELDFQRYPDTPDPGPGQAGYIAFAFGVDSGTVPTDFTAIGSGDFAVLFQQANNGNAANAEAFEDNTSLGTFDYLNPDVPHSLVLTATPQSIGAYGDADLIDINVLVDGSISQDFTVLGGANFGSFTVSANNFEARWIDNLVVSAVPEPGSAALGLLGLGLIAFRRKRSV